MFALIARAAIFVIAVASLGGAHSADISRWVDSNGVTHYSEQPPRGVKAVRIEKPLVPDAASQQQAEIEAKRLIERSKQGKLDGSPGGVTQQQVSEKAQRDLASRVRRCDTARQQLEVVQLQGRAYRTDANGERIYLDDADRPKELQRLRDEVKSECDAATLEASEAEGRRSAARFQRPACTAALDTWRGLQGSGAQPAERERALERAREATRRACT